MQGQLDFYSKLLLIADSDVEATSFYYKLLLVADSSCPRWRQSDTIRVVFLSDFLGPRCRQPDTVLVVFIELLEFERKQPNTFELFFYWTSRVQEERIKYV